MRVPAPADPRPAAVVGAGLGGSAVAYFSQQQFGPQVQLDVYEQAGVGGRLATVTVNKQQYESRGASIHALSLHMQDFVKTLGEQMLPDVPRGRGHAASPSLSLLPSPGSPRWDLALTKSPCFVP